MGLNNPLAVQGKVLQFLRSTTAASGDVAYTGAGFQPRAVIILVEFPNGTNRSFSIGINGPITNDGGSLWEDETREKHVSAGYVVMAQITGGQGQIATLKSMDADGFTLTWTYTATLTASNLVIIALCLR